MSEDDRLEELVEEARAARKIAQTALQEKAALESKVDELVDDLTEEVERLKAKNDRLEYRIAELEAEKPDRSTEYESLTLEDKVARVREELMIHANASMSGVASLDYRDVMVSLFEDKPSADHAYKLMRLAGEKDGFAYENPPNGNRRVTVDLEVAKRSPEFSHAKKDASEEGV